MFNLLSIENGGKLWIWWLKCGSELSKMGKDVFCGVKKPTANWTELPSLPLIGHHIEKIGFRVLSHEFSLRWLNRRCIHLRSCQKIRLLTLWCLSYLPIQPEQTDQFWLWCLKAIWSQLCHCGLKALLSFSLNPDELRGAGRRRCNIPCLQGLSDQGQRSWAKDVSRNVSYRLLGGSELSHSFDGRCIVGLGPLGRGYDQLPPPRLQPLQPNLPALQRILKKSPKDHPKSKHWIMMGLLLTQVLDWVYSLQHLYHLGLTETNPFQQVCWLYFKWWSNGAPKQFYIYIYIYYNQQTCPWKTSLVVISGAWKGTSSNHWTSVYCSNQITHAEH